MGDEAANFLEDFATAWRDSRLSRVLCYALFGAVILAIVATAISDLTRPRIYIVRDEVKESA